MSPASASNSSVKTANPAPFLGFELAADPELGSALLRDRAIAAHCVGKARTAKVRMVFHDSADGALAASGLSLVIEPRGRGAVQQLIRIRPRKGDHAYPGQPPIGLAEVGLAAPTPDLDALADILPKQAKGAALPAIATAIGRRTTLKLAPDGMTATLVAGELRAAAAERPFARLTLSIPVAAAAEGLALLRTLVAEYPIVVAARALAEEARALALGLPFEPLHQGAFDLGATASVEEGARSAIGHLTRAFLTAVPIAIEGSDPEGVHQTRVAIRRLRSVLTVFRPAIGCNDLSLLKTRLGELSRTLGAARDWDVLLGGALADVARTFAGDPAIASLARAAEAARKAAYTAVREALTGPAFRLLAVDLAASVADPPWHREEVPDEQATPLRTAPLKLFARGALARRYKRMMRVGKEFEKLDVPALHALRIQAKRMRYTSDLFALLFDSKRRQRFHKSLVRIQDSLGHLNDSAVVAHLMQKISAPESSRSWAAGILQGWVAARAEIARADAAKAWAAFVNRPPFWRD
jgi:triphosphatase